MDWFQYDRDFCHERANEQLLSEVSVLKLFLIAIVVINCKILIIKAIPNEKQIN